MSNLREPIKYIEFVKLADYKPAGWCFHTCDLQDVNYVFGADLLCHKTWTKHYFKKYEKLLRDKGTPHYPIWWQDIFIPAK